MEELRLGGHLDGLHTQWIGGPMNEARAKLEDAKVMDEPQGKTYQCPRCGAPLDMIAEHAHAELWECARCGFDKLYWRLP